MHYRHDLREGQSLSTLEHGDTKTPAPLTTGRAIKQETDKAIVPGGYDGRKGHPMDGQLDLFAAPTPAPAAPPTAATTDRDARARWTGIHGNRPCDDCIGYLHTHAGIGPNPKRATTQRTIKATGEHGIYCREHAEPRQEADHAAAATK